MHQQCAQELSGELSANLITDITAKSAISEP